MGYARRIDLIAHTGFVSRLAKRFDQLRAGRFSIVLDDGGTGPELDIHL
jgi:hypothetical protein